MLPRRTLALFLVVAVLATIFAIPPAPSLVCRMTGQPMAPMAATPEHARSCCAIALIPGGATLEGGQPRYALTSPGCCDLRQTFFKRATLSAVSSADPVSHLLAVTWLPAPPVLRLSVRAVNVPLPPVVDASAPRGPPGRSLSPRAPPAVS